MAYIEFKNVCKEYDNKEKKIKILKNVIFNIEKGEFVIITGPSSSEKTSILNILNGNIKLDSGEVLIDNTLINKLSERKLKKYKRENISFLCKDDVLLKNLTIQENIELGALVSKDPLNIDEIIKKIGLTKKKDEFYYNLSLDEQKKVSLAMKIIKNSNVFLVDEIIESLELKSKIQILKLLKSLCKKDKKVVIITTNDDSIFPIANKIIKIKNGSLTNMIINKKPKAIGDLKC